MGKAKCIMVQGTMSGAGKSLLCAALCRIFKQDGYKVAPFKSQNMALNSYVTRNGMEMGRAQVMQAEAAGIEPDVRMNPVLLKPSSDIGSQVIVLGEVRGQMTATEYYEYKNSLMPEVMKAYNELAEENDIIVIEGAGSPAEINLRENDIVNMGMAEAAGAPVLLAGDIDRGGVFAQLYGTVKLLTEDEQKRIAGLIVNKFRGDIDILAPGLKMVEEKTGIPVLGVIPYIRVDIDDEDSLAPRLNAKSEVKPLDIAIIRIPRMSNFTDFAPLEAHEVIGARYVQSAEELHNPDMVIIPGTKSTMDDLLWMRQNGIESAIQKLASSGTPVLGVCGGYQMMGEKLSDPYHIEGDLEEMHGMGLLPTETTFTQIKTRTRFTADVKAKDFEGAKLDGYEIH
ncbi:MAG: cobyric acid synthase, partial [[Eubacterium] sulci]|nr:cobyric acid synthase [[Eubacterium] sulci]